ncbi:hypothetical protein ES703_36543 [subsurface metagenome]
MTKKTGHTVFLDPEDVQFLEEKGRETGCSLSTLIRGAVKKWIREQKREQKSR